MSALTVEVPCAPPAMGADQGEACPQPSQEGTWSSMLGGGWLCLKLARWSAEGCAVG